MNEDNLNEKHIIDWLLSSSAVDIVKLLFMPLYSNGLKSKSFDFLWGPVVERESAVRPFFLKSPDELFAQTSDIDVLIGYSTNVS